MEPMSVAAHAMRRAQPDKDGICVICGLGTIGMLILMFLKDAGMRNILAVGNKDFQWQTAAKLGLEEDCCCDSRTEDVSKWIMEHTDNRGADMFFECVGRNETASQALDLTAPAGKVNVCREPGFGYDNSKSGVLEDTEESDDGVGNMEFFIHAQHGRRLALCDGEASNHRIRPEELVTHRFPLERLSDGLILMHDKLEESGKVMII